MNDITNELKNLFGERLKEQEPMATHVNFRIGGPARWFTDVRTVEELQQAVELCEQNEVPYFVLGGGSNTLVSDEGFEGVVLKMALRSFEIEGNTVIADAGVISASLARATATAGLAGFAWAISLPGTIGGAVRGNAGCFGGETKDYLTKVLVLRDGALLEIPKEELKMGYRDSAIKHSNDIVVRAWFELPEGDKEALTAQLTETLNKRKASQPLSAGSAGCMFKNYEIQDASEKPQLEQKGVPEAMLENGKVSAGWVVDQLDLKGVRIGDAMISNEHGNFIVNLGNATASDIVQLVAMVKTRARNEFGVQLHEEVQYLGF